MREMEGASTGLSAADALARLPTPMRLAFDEAWRSWQAGSFGIGAVLVEPTDGSVVATGRNRVAQRSKDLGVLSGNMTAHAEMNAFAALDRFNAEGLHLHTTLQPCLMCSATAMQLKVAHVHFAAADEFFDELDEIWDAGVLTRARVPARNGPLDGDLTRLGHVARLLPMAFTIDRFPGRAAERLARERHPELATLIDDLERDGSLHEIKRLPSLDEGVDELWNRLPR